MNKFFLFLFSFILISFSSVSYALQFKPSQISITSSDEDFIYSHYFQIEVDEKASKIDLLKLNRIDQTFPLPVVPYKRDEHFGGWLNDPNDDTCLNTRGKVLVRDSLSQVKYATSGCSIYAGEWADPYTDRVYSYAKEVQIDHVVALKNAYMTGAHEWDFLKRCLYANYMGNKFHLLPVDGPENLRKSDHTPSGYVPPNKEFTCEFVKTWLNIKVIWSLRITPQEAEAIQKIVNDNQCSPELFKITAQSLEDQHRYMENHANLCAPSTLTLQTFKQ